MLGGQNTEVKQFTIPAFSMNYFACSLNCTYRYDVALASNALGAQYGCEFAKKCPNLKLLLHVSTGTCSFYIYAVVHTIRNGAELYNTMSMYMIGQLQ